MKNLSLCAALLLTGCSSEPTPDKIEVDTAEAAVVETCESIVDDVIALSEDNTPSLLKIYKPEKISETDKELVCKGSAMSSLGSERLPVFFKRFIDEEGTAFIQYSGEPFEVTATK